MSITRISLITSLRDDAAVMFGEMARIKRLPDPQSQVDAMAGLAEEMWHWQARFRIVAAMPGAVSDGDWRGF